MDDQADIQTQILQLEKDQISSIDPATFNLLSTVENDKNPFSSSFTAAHEQDLLAQIAQFKTTLLNFEDLNAQVKSENFTLLLENESLKAEIKQAIISSQLPLPAAPAITRKESISALGTQGKKWWGAMTAKAPAPIPDASVNAGVGLRVPSESGQLSQHAAVGEAERGELIEKIKVFEAEIVGLRTKMGINEAAANDNDAMHAGRYAKYETASAEIEIKMREKDQNQRIQIEQLVSEVNELNARHIVRLLTEDILISTGNHDEATVALAFAHADELNRLTTRIDQLQSDITVASGSLENSVIERQRLDIESDAKSTQLASISETNVVLQAQLDTLNQKLVDMTASNAEALESASNPQSLAIKTLTKQHQDENDIIAATNNAHLGNLNEQISTYASDVGSLRATAVQNQLDLDASLALTQAQQDTITALIVKCTSNETTMQGFAASVKVLESSLLDKDASFAQLDRTHVQACTKLQEEVDTLTSAALLHVASIQAKDLVHEQTIIELDCVNTRLNVLVKSSVSTTQDSTNALSEQQLKFQAEIDALQATLASKIEETSALFIKVLDLETLLSSNIASSQISADQSSLVQDIASLKNTLENEVAARGQLLQEIETLHAHSNQNQKTHAGDQASMQAIQSKLEADFSDIEAKMVAASAVSVSLEADVLEKHLLIEDLKVLVASTTTDLKIATEQMKLVLGRHEEEQDAMVYNYEEKIRAFEFNAANTQPSAENGDSLVIDDLKSTIALLEAKIAADLASVSITDQAREIAIQIIADERAEMERYHKSQLDSLDDLIKSKDKAVADLQDTIIDSTQKLIDAEALVVKTNKDSDLAKRKASQDKEAHTMLVQTLQENMAEMQSNSNQNSLNSSNKKEIDRFKKEKLELDERLKKDKLEFENTARKDKIKYQLEVEKIKKEFQVLDQQKADQSKIAERDGLLKSEELVKEKAKLVKLEADMTFLRGETQKVVADTHKRMQTGESDALQKNRAAESSIAEHIKTVTELEAFKVRVAELQAQHDGLNLELEVQQSSNQRFHRIIAEKEEINKKLKSKGEEVVFSDRLTKKQLEKAEIELGAIKAEIQLLSLEKLAKEKDQIVELEAIRCTLIENQEKCKDMEVKLGLVNRMCEGLEEKVQFNEAHTRSAERKNQILIRDLQKQVVRERRHSKQPCSTDGPLSPGSPKSVSGKSKASPVSITGSFPSSISAEEKKQLTDQILALASENEALNKRVHAHVDELKATTERCVKMTEETEKKSKVIQQYALREHSSKLQPDPKPGLFNMSILSSKIAMQRMDPVMLSQINDKLQKLIEELSSRIVLVEMELEKLTVLK